MELGERYFLYAPVRPFFASAENPGPVNVSSRTSVQNDPRNAYLFTIDALERITFNHCQQTNVS